MARMALNSAAAHARFSRWSSAHGAPARSKARSGPGPLVRSKPVYLVEASASAATRYDGLYVRCVCQRLRWIKLRPGIPSRL